MAQLIADAMKRAGITSAPLATNPAPSPPTAPGEDLGAILSAIPQANRGPGSAIEPPTRADDLFEALYRDGVDLSWP